MATKRDCERAAKFAPGARVRMDDPDRSLWGVPCIVYGEVVAVRRPADVPARDPGEFETKWAGHSVGGQPVGGFRTVVGGADLRFDT